MSGHRMVTRSQKKHVRFTGQSSETPKPAFKKIIRKPVHLTEDLLYIVNKKLRSMDNSERKRLIQDLDPLDLTEPSEPFTDVVYRRTKYWNLSQTQLAVMHKINFDSNSTAVCKLNSMNEFFSHLFRGARFAGSREFRKFLSYDDRIAGSKAETSVVRYVQLPKDYFRPHSDCVFFGELAWKENGVMMVDSENFALCLLIWKLKEWIVLPRERHYPLSCQRVHGPSCRCRNLLDAMWTDDFMRMFFHDQGIVNNISVIDTDDGLRRHNALESAQDHMQTFCRKLITGEEMISRSNRAFNVLAATQLQRILQELDTTLRCIDRQHLNEDTDSIDSSDIDSDGCSIM